MRISKRYTRFIHALIMAFFMSLIMSLTMTAINVGWSETLLTVWPKGWLVGFIVGLPTAIVVGPIAGKMVERFTV